MKEPLLCSDLAEFVGIILGDGNINEKGFVSITGKEREYIDNHVLKLMRGLFGIGHLYEHPDGFFRAQTKSLPLINYLLSIGLKSGNKLHNGIRVPDWILGNDGFLKKCLKGFFDADGSIFKHYKWNTLYVEFKCRSRSILESLYEGLLSLGFELTKLESERFYIRVKHNQRFFQEIGFNHPKHLNRLKRLLKKYPALAQSGRESQ